ncbi:MAG: response regulator [Halobacteriovoraceae bacterium]|nr:response regulator [Halobacteriovoraceae bacterium]
MNSLLKITKDNIQRPLAKKLLVRILLVSSFVTLILTSFQLSKDYLDDYNFLLHKLSEIESSNISSLAQSVWVLNKEQIKIQLEGLLKIPDIEYLELKIDIGEVYKTGNTDNISNKLERIYKIKNNIDGQEITLGQLKVVASKDTMMDRLREKSIIILLSQTTKTFFVSFFILLIFYQLIGRHLSTISNFASSINLDSLGEELSLKRKSNKNETDELDHIVDSLNSMRTRLKEDFQKKIEYQKALIETDKKILTISNNIPGLVFQFKVSENKITITHISTGGQNIYQVDEDLFLNNPAKLLALLQLENVYEISQSVFHDEIEKEILKEVKIVINNKTLWGQLNINVFKEVDGVILWTGVLIDKTNIKIQEQKSRELEEKLNQTQKMEALGTLAGGIAHDFNNILQGIFNALSLIDSEHLQEEEKESIRNIESFSLRGKELIKKILIFSRKDVAEEKVIDLQRTIEESLHMVRATIPSYHNIEFSGFENSLKVLASNIQINQIILNICINASHALDENGTITLNLDQRKLKDGDFAVLTISDNGHGMTKDIRNRIFEPFFTTKQSGQGSGMGMSVVHGIIQNLGGRISVSSEINKGTTFTILLPLTNKEILKEDESQFDNIEKNFESKRIVLIDDEKESLSLCAKVLEKNGFKVEKFDQPLKALDYIKNQNIDQISLILTDLTMPQMTGLELAKQLKLHGINIPIILMTGYMDESISDMSIFSGTILKPFSRREIIEQIGRVI